MRMPVCGPVHGVFTRDDETLTQMSEREHGLLVYAGLHDQTATYGRLSYSCRQAARRRRDDVCRTRSEKHDTASATTGVGRHRTFAPFPHISRLQKLPSLTSAPRTGYGRFEVRTLELGFGAELGYQGQCSLIRIRIKACSRYVELN